MKETVGSEISGAHSSTTMNVEKYIQDTELSDGIFKQDDLSAQMTSTQTQSKNNTGSDSAVPNDVSSQSDDDMTDLSDLSDISEVSVKSAMSDKNTGAAIGPPNASMTNGVGIHKSPTLNGILKNAYQTKLKYLPNQDFSVDDSFAFSIKNMPLNSIPNTFNYKSHPNAQTKAEIGKGGSIDTNESKKENIEKVETSAQNIILEEKESNRTPDWIPHELHEKWIAPPTLLSDHNESPVDDMRSSVRIYRTSKEPSSKVDFNLNVSSTNTMIHNSDQHVNETPMWKKATKKYEHAKNAEQLKNIFLTSSTNEDQKASFDIKDINNHVNSSTLSTSFTSLNRNKDSNIQADNSEDPNIQDGSHSKENPQTNQFLSPYPESPLKLFGDKYNTFTKEKLTHLLAQMNSKKSNAQATSNQEAISKKEESTSSAFQAPKLKIKKFPRSDSYTEEEFLRNANNIFDNIQKRGFTTKADHLQLGNNQTTSTSTPLNGKKVRSIKSLESGDNFSCTSDFNGGSATYYKVNESEKEGKNYTSSMNEYTSFNNTSKGTGAMDTYHSLSNKNLEKLQNELSNSSSYTYDSLSETDVIDSAHYDEKSRVEERIASARPAVETKPMPNKNNENGEIRILNSRIRDLEETVKRFQEKDVEKILDELSMLRQQIELQNQDKTEDSVTSTSNVFDDINEDISDQNVIRWKRASQLRLNQAERPSRPTTTDRNLEKAFIGRVKPGALLPSEYDDMVLDAVNHRWVFNNKENMRENSLDFIEDLSTRSDFINEGTPLKEINSRRLTQQAEISKKTSNKLDVSFQLPHIEQSSRRGSPNNITQVSQLDNVTFSQVRKKLVAIITDKLSGDRFDNTPWTDVSSISLASYGLQNVKDLDKFLPSLEDLDISNNELKFLDGIPNRILRLSVPNNLIENITSFRNFHDLQSLDVSYNRLKSLTNFDRNIHLTQLNVSNNSLISLDGIMELQNLIKLNVSQNSLGGKVSFLGSKLQSLQSLNLSENSIRIIEGIESLEDLRILNLNENKLEQVSCKKKHPHLKKLSLKFNNLIDLDVTPFPHLRVLRFDCNKLDRITGLKHLKHIDEVACKSQDNSVIIETVIDEMKDMQILDISGNSTYDLFNHSQKLYKQMHSHLFWNVNKLVLSAMDLTEIPHYFADLFPNVRELDLNFNRLTNIDGLSNLRKLRKLYMVSNNISKIESILNGLLGARVSLTVLDLRLNPCNIELYPYVFNPQELEYGKIITKHASPIQLDTADDIENFAIHYRSLSKNADDWIERDNEFINKLSSGYDSKKVNRRLNYETILVNFFLKLKSLDGGFVSDEKRRLFQNRLSKK